MREKNCIVKTHIIIYIYNTTVWNEIAFEHFSKGTVSNKNCLIVCHNKFFVPLCIDEVVIRVIILSLF